MKQNKLGRTELHVSELCLGTLSFGWSTPEPLSVSILDAFREAGGNFIQASGLGPEIEGSPVLSNPSEEYVGRWLADRQVPRHELIIGTRVALRRHQPGPEYVSNALLRCCESSIHRLGCGHLDLLLVEWHDSLPPTDDLLAAIDILKRAGLVRCVGASGFPTWRVMESIGRAARLNTNRFEVVQCDYSLLDRGRYEEDTLDLCQEHRLGFLARSPLAGGFLLGGGPGSPHTARSQWLRARYTSAHSDVVVSILGEIAAARRVTPQQVALAWVIANPRVTSPVIGVNNLDHLLASIEATGIELTADELNRLGAAVLPASIPTAPIQSAEADPARS
ncbi:oxidoreductase [Opitutaceae bacterium TAV5]|nr:oxidoreductase [Opitutaceae bacterium TAV5]